MASRRADRSDNSGHAPSAGREGWAGRLWQTPLLIFSLGLFAYAAYLFIDPRPGLSIEQRIAAAQSLLDHERPDAAREQLVKLLEGGNIPRENEAKVHLLLAQAVEGGQKQKKLDIAANHEQIVQHTKAAIGLGFKPDAAVFRRLGESYEALDRTGDALENYRRAIALDPDRALHLQRKVIDLQIAKGDAAAAEASLHEYLKDAKLADSERSWALGEKSRLLADRGSFIEARTLLAEALRMDADPVARGQVYYRMGYCAWKLGDNAEAERLLRVARDELRVQHPLDADAAQLLGRILQDEGEPQAAISFYQDVIVSHPDSAAGPLARLGRGVCRIQGDQDEGGLADLHDLVNEIASKPSRARYKADAVAGLRTSADALVARHNYQGALELLALEQTLEPEPAAEFFARLGSVFEKRADQLERATTEAMPPAERLRRGQQVRDLLTKAASASIANSRALTVADDQAHGEALWKGIDLYDRAGSLSSAIAALELFVAENPGDGLAPEALLRLGRAYQAAGMFDKAIGAFQRNQFRYPQSLAASKSGVPLAQAYVAKGPEFYSKAESALLSTIGSPLVTPDAEEFRDALFELAQLFYRTGRYEEAVVRLEELTERYPAEERMGQLLFLMADSYRKSAALLKDSGDAQVRAASATASAVAAPQDAGPAARASLAAHATQAEVAAARRDRLSRARKLYDRVIEQFRAAPPPRDLDKLYLKLAHFYRADCAYDNGSYEEAIRLYDAAALRYQDDPSALAAYVQIVNAYCALGRRDDAKTANERAKWLLKKMPPEAFQDGKFSLDRKYWDDWLTWSNNVGMW